MVATLMRSSCRHYPLDHSRESPISTATRAAPCTTILHDKSLNNLWGSSGTGVEIDFYLRRHRGGAIGGFLLNQIAALDKN